MRVGPKRRLSVNELTLYGTHIYMISSESAYNMQVWVPGTDHASLTPITPGTCNIGTSSYPFDYSYAYHHQTVSARRYKKNIKEAENFYTSIDDLRPVTFEMINSQREETFLGFIAEEVDEVCPLLVSRNDDGEISGLDYSKFVVLLVDEVKKLRKRVADLEG